MNKPGQKALLPCEQNFKMLCHRCIRLGINIWKWFKDNMECLAQIPVQRLTVPTRFCPIGPTYARFCPIGPTYTRFCSIGPTHIRFLKVVICFQISLTEKRVLFMNMSSLHSLICAFDIQHFFFTGSLHFSMS